MLSTEQALHHRYHAQQLNPYSVGGSAESSTPDNGTWTLQNGGDASQAARKDLMRRGRRHSPPSSATRAIFGVGGSGAGGAPTTAAGAIFWNLLFCVAVLAAAVWAGMYAIASHDEALRREVRTEEKNLAWIELQDKIKSLQLEKNHLKRDLIHAQAAVAAATGGKELVGHGDSAALSRQVTLLREQKARLQTSIQKLSKMRLLERFGPGPHYVEILVVFDPHSNVAVPEGHDHNSHGNPNYGRIVLEMAPVQDMPHTVMWFLEQVDRQLYDGCSFHRNAAHVIQAGAVPNFLTRPDTQLFQRFEHSGITNVLFQEYSERFPHVAYTLGYAGRPGGPDFYINTKDNTVPHGPGGQSSYEDATEADPCFAKVIEGFDVVDRMHQSATAPGGYNRMDRAVAIVSMKILPTHRA